MQVGIEDPHQQAGLAQRRRQIYGGRGFADAALARKNGDFVFDVLQRLRDGAVFNQLLLLSFFEFA
ncbi:MAG: hypothetical protein MZV70_05425 [Desulfobacterales bacterium]|nr:hypothetical protein [Desulfobacterales bacterium]